MTIKAIIYDFDGTIADTAYEYAKISARVFLAQAQAQPNQNRPSEEALALFLVRPDITGLSTKDKLEKVKDTFGLDLTARHKDISNTLRSLKAALYDSPDTKFLPNLIIALRDLMKQGRLQAIASTNQPELLNKAVERMNLKTIFGEAVLSSIEGEPKKPAPDMLIRAAKALGVKPEECVYIGDATSDMQAAKAAGMKAIGIYPRGEKDQEGQEAFRAAGADVIIHDFSLLLHALHELEQDQAQTQKPAPFTPSYL